jgi:hypothetical protein
MTRVTRVFAAAALLLCFGVSAAQAANPSPKSLTGEAFIASGLPARGVSQVTGTCNPLGESSFTFHVEGEAVGPYTGTFVEDGTFTIAPVATPVLSAFNATFTITSPAGTVTGTKTLAADLGPVNVAVCGPFTQFVPNDPNSIEFQATTRYTATVPGGSDSGQAVVSYQDLQVRDVPDVNTFSFSENFVSTGFQAGPPQKATGGGRIAPDVSFGFVAISDGSKGDCSVVDHTTGTRVKCLDVTSYSQAGDVATFSGDATVNGAPTTYTGQVTDGGEPGGAVDAFLIQTGTGYTAGGPLLEGNIQVHG